MRGLGVLLIYQVESFIKYAKGFIRCNDLTYMDKTYNNMYQRNGEFMFVLNVISGMASIINKQIEARAYFVIEMKLEPAKRCQDRV